MAITSMYAYTLPRPTNLQIYPAHAAMLGHAIPLLTYQQTHLLEPTCQPTNLPTFKSILSITTKYKWPETPLQILLIYNVVKNVKYQQADEDNRPAWPFFFFFTI